MFSWFWKGFVMKEMLSRFKGQCLKVAKYTIKRGEMQGVSSGQVEDVL